jgi:hypothetical protein
MKSEIKIFLLPSGHRRPKIDVIGLSLLMVPPIYLFSILLRVTIWSIRTVRKKEVS